MSTPPQAAPVPPKPERPRELVVYGHSALFYWWPVWAVGFLMAIWTYYHDSRVAIVPAGSQYRDEEGRRYILLPAKGELESHPDLPERMHSNKNLGVIYTAVFFVVILISNIPLRGLASAVTVITILFFVLLFAYLGWWDDILRWFGFLTVHMNMGFYITFSSLILFVWVFATFVYDRMDYYRVRPGQLTHEYFWGGGERSYDTIGIAFEKLRGDLFRHWVLGLGSGDLVISTAGARSERIEIHNVLFVGTKMRRIQELIAEKPSEDKP